MRQLVKRLLLPIFVAALGGGAAACDTSGQIDDGEGQLDEPDFHAEESLPATNDIAFSGASTVGQYAAISCSTSGIRPLSIQIAREINCMSPGTLSHFSEGGGVTFASSAVLPYLDAKAATALRAVASHTGSVQVTSAFRTVAQQWLLYHWYVIGRCGIPIAATPGHSNHESARAVDLANWASVRGTMAAHGWAHDVPGDSVHFDHLASPDIRGMDVHAFQRLWNRNHPGDRIAEDGDYGPQTAARIAKAPIGGFAKGPLCN